ncbi:acetaldehyde dehydrogenase [Streptomyces sp. NPDC001404]|uniref:acetaldehyde dehydrogenase n=1 Tax=Streptomyces sp. NPDC001404 TaxID=3364571 RepID=UPI0036C9C21C
MSNRPQLRAAVIGAGMLGIDLAGRLTRSTTMTCALVAGRSTSTTGLRLAARMGCATSTGGIDAVTGAGIDVVFDASNAGAHPAHWAALASAGVLLLDLTPSSSGTMVVPTVNGFRAESSRHLSLVSCGGQAVLPVLDVVARHCTPEYIEVVTTVASASAGRATRLNLDEYIATTEYAVRRLTHVPRAKVMTTISPALPAPVFRAQVTVLASGIRPGRLRAGVEAAADAVRAFAPGFEVASLAVEDQLIRATVQVTARDGRLPAYAGNVEIINAAAVLLAERHAAAREVETL